MKIYGRLSLTYLLTHPLTHLLIQHRYSHENNDNIIYQTNTWKDLMLENVTFSLVKEKIVTIGYSVCVQPQLASIIKGRDMEYISSRYTTLSLTHSLTYLLTHSIRIILDGQPFSDGSSTFGTGTYNPSSGILSGQLTVKLIPGEHTVNVQWRKMGNIFKSWGSNPSYLDGFASSRNIYILRYSISLTHSLTH